MGNAITATKRACQNLWNVSTSKSLAGPQTAEQIAQADRERALLEAEERLREIQRIEADTEKQLVEEQQRRFKEDRQKDEAYTKVRSNVTVELRELRKTLQQLVIDLEAPVEQGEKPPEDHLRPFTRLDDYVHETMHALLVWLGSKEEFQIITMSQLMFFLKSPHIKQRRKFILSVERILRAMGRSLFEKDQTADPKELALGFDIVAKKRTQGLQREKILREIRQQQQMQEVQRVLARQEKERQERLAALMEDDD